MVTWILACIITTTAFGMSAVSAWDRGGTGIDRALLVALSIAICAGTHFLPALSKRKVAWLLWVGCLAGTVYGHVTFLTNASLRAGAARAQSSVEVVGVRKQQDAVRDALSMMTTRSVTTVADELSRTRQWRRRQALSSELAEAKRAAELRDDLVRLSATATVTEVTASKNPVTVLVAKVTGSNPASIELVIWFCLSILLELVGALLWWEALGKPKAVGTGYPSPTGDPVAELRVAIADGRCKPTVSAIREFIGCGQARALELRRQLIEVGSNSNNNEK